LGERERERDPPWREREVRALWRGWD